MHVHFTKVRPSPLIFPLLLRSLSSRSGFPPFPNGPNKIQNISFRDTSTCITGNSEGSFLGILFDTDLDEKHSHLNQGQSVHPCQLVDLHPLLRNINSTVTAGLDL